MYDNPEVSEIDDYTPDAYNPHLGMQLLLDRGDNQPEMARVTKRLKDDKGNPIEKAHNNPLVDIYSYV